MVGKRKKQTTFHLPGDLHTAIDDIAWVTDIRRSQVVTLILQHALGMKNAVHDMLGNLEVSGDESLTDVLAIHMARFADEAPSRKQMHREKSSPPGALLAREDSEIPMPLRGLRLYSGDLRLRFEFDEFWKSCRNSFPHINLMSELMKAHSWEESNPKKRKRDRKRFLHGWFKRAQDDWLAANPNPEEGTTNAPRDENWEDRIPESWPEDWANRAVHGYKYLILAVEEVGLNSEQVMEISRERTWTS